MSFVSQVTDFLQDRAGQSPFGLIISSATWPMSLALRRPVEQLVPELCEGLREKFPESTIVSPTFTRGFGEHQICDLDAEPGTTGLLGEHFRGYSDAGRTRSAFFSFAVLGPSRRELVEMRPRYAWGKGSLYWWLHEHDADIVTIGLHPTQSSVLHLSEWRMKVPYRCNKTFSGLIRHEGRLEELTETLFVRQIQPSPINDFTRALPALVEHGLTQRTIDGVRVSHVGARAAIGAIDGLLGANPFAVLRNEEDMRNAGAE